MYDAASWKPAVVVRCMCLPVHSTSTVLDPISPTSHTVVGLAQLPVWILSLRLAPDTSEPMLSRTCPSASVPATLPRPPPSSRSPPVLFVTAEPFASCAATLNVCVAASVARCCCWMMGDATVGSKASDATSTRTAELLSLRYCAPLTEQ